MDPETVGFYTFAVYLILLSDHNDSVSTYSRKIVTDYSFKGKKSMHGEKCFKMTSGKFKGVWQICVYPLYSSVVDEMMMMMMMIGLRLYDFMPLI